MPDVSHAAASPHFDPHVKSVTGHAYIKSVDVVRSHPSFPSFLFLTVIFSNMAVDQEILEFQQEVEAVKKWWASDRFKHVKRPYTAEAIVSKRGTLPTEYRSNAQAKKLWKLLQKNKATGETTHTFGALGKSPTRHVYLDQQLY